MTTSADTSQSMQHVSFLTGGGAMDALFRSMDWTGTPLGPPSMWPLPLKTLVGVMLGADQPMFVGWGPDHILLYNDSYAAILADRHPQSLGRAFFDVWPEVRADLTPLFQQVSAGQAIHMDDIELFLDRPGKPNEAHFTFSYTPVRDESGAVAGLFCACMETSVQILAERALREAEASERNRLWVLTEDLLARANFEGRMSAVNPAWTTLLGWPEAHLLATPYLNFMHPDDADISFAAIEAMARTGKPTRFENRIATTAGEWTSIDWTVSPEPGGLNFIAIGRDLTDAKHVERMKTEFVATVSHELRTPLTSITGSLGLLSGGAAGALPDRAAQLVAIAYNNCERLIRLINDILDIEKIKSGRVVFDNRPIDLARAVEHNVQANAGFAQTHGVTIAFAAPTATATVIADPDRLAQIFTNLLSNAVKFSPAGGIVDVTVTALDRDWRVSIADRGPGIPTTFRDRIFGKFAQADSSDTRSRGGTGLGLAIVRDLVRCMGGSVGFEDRAGGGTIFTIILPAAAASTDSSQIISEC